MSGELHQALLSWGFKFTPAHRIPTGTPLRSHDDAKGFYVKNYITLGGDFSVALSFRGDPHLTLPTAYVLKFPDQFVGRLMPHINMGWYLCYVREMEADWDPNDLHKLYKDVDGQIQLTLDASVASVTKGLPTDQEMEGEFSSYWLSDEDVYLLSDAVEKVEMECLVATGRTRTGKARSSGEEWVVYEKNDEHVCDAWLKQRNLTQRDVQIIHASYFKVKPSRLAGVVWPPQDLRAVLEWLTENDQGALSRILNYFINNPVKRHVLLLDVYQQDLVGLFVEFNLEATGLKTYPKNGKRRKGSGRTVKTKSLVACLSAKRSVNRFIRLGVTRADKKTLLNRNRRRSAIGDLSKQRIALIGCGTVGGYLAGLLLRAGAGCGRASFDIYDHDFYGPHNFGRHPLATEHFGNNKAMAMAGTLKSSTHLPCKVTGKPFQFPIEEEQLKQYDIIIDATGRHPVAKRLAHVIRTISSKEKPRLVHGFNDGNGRASKVVIDVGGSCFGCLLANPDIYRDGVDKRFFGLNSSGEKFISCGNTFTPYDAAVSVITASLMQEAVLSILEPEVLWNYSEHMLDGGRSLKPRILPRQPSCSICQYA